MEIERKFLIVNSNFSNLCECAEIEQGYLTIDPEVRIRRKLVSLSNRYGPYEDFKLTIKSDGILYRDEIEKYLTKKEFNTLKNLISFKMITKDYRKYYVLHSNGKKYYIDTSIVDKGTLNEFQYAEVEFRTIEEANEYIPHEFLGEEITDNLDYKMKNYWWKTRIRNFLS